MEHTEIFKKMLRSIAIKYTFQKPDNVDTETMEYETEYINSPKKLKNEEVPPKKSIPGECPYCDQYFTDLIIHLKPPQKNILTNFDCNGCQLILPIEECILNHKRNIHLFGTPFLSCKLCSIGFSSKNSLNFHVTLCHPEPDLVDNTEENKNNSKSLASEKSSKGGAGKKAPMKMGMEADNNETGYNTRASNKKYIPYTTTRVIGQRLKKKIPNSKKKRQGNTSVNKNEKNTDSEKTRDAQHIKVFFCQSCESLHVCYWDRNAEKLFKLCHPNEEYNISKMQPIQFKCYENDCPHEESVYSKLVRHFKEKHKHEIIKPEKVMVGHCNTTAAEILESEEKVKKSIQNIHDKI